MTDEDHWNSMPLRYRLELLARFHWRTPGVCISSLAWGMSPFAVMRHRQLQRWIQIGGEQCSERDYERFMNEMPLSDFVTLLLSDDSSEDETSNEGNRNVA